MCAHDISTRWLISTEAQGSIALRTKMKQPGGRTDVLEDSEIGWLGGGGCPGRVTCLL
jgi:hypothetical protein